MTEFYIFTSLRPNEMTLMNDRMTLTNDRMTLIKMPLSINDTQSSYLNANCHNSECRNFWRCAECDYGECHYGECHFFECHYAECHYAECLIF